MWNQVCIPTLSGMRRWTLAFAITGFVVAVLMVITILVLWNVFIIGDFRTIKELSGSLETLRNGPIGTVNLVFLHAQTKFENRAEDTGELPEE